MVMCLPQLLFKPQRLLIYCAFLLLFCGAAPAAPKNVLLIYIDDLRPELGAYGQSHVHSPHIDTLAAEGLLFERAYVQQAVCHPSRVSTLTGVRPDTAGVTDLHSDFRVNLPDIQTLPQLFKDAGYHAIPFGKIYHAPSVNDAASWSESGQGFGIQYHDPATSGTPPFENPTNNPPDADYADAKIATAAITRIETLATDYSQNNKPFFVAVGFLKPHLPFVAPRAYWDLYDPATLPIASGADALPPSNALSAYLRDGFSGELQTYPGGQPTVGNDPNTNITLHQGTTRIYPEFYARQLYHGYVACVSFIDAQVGRLIAALNDPNGDGDNSDSLIENTIIVLVGDHGYHLGQHGSWPKHTNFDIANHAPLIIRAPGMGAAGQRSNSIVEFLDLYPTLVELAGLTPPAHLEGSSFAALFDDATLPTHNIAISQYPRSAGNADYMSYSIRTERFRYIEWRRLDSGLVEFRELYDHHDDPKENHNLADDPVQAANIETLATQLAAKVGPSAGNMPGGSEVYEGFFYANDNLESDEIGGSGWLTGWFGWSDLQYSKSGTAVTDTTWNLPTGYGWTPFGGSGRNDLSSTNQPTRALQERNHIDLGQEDTRYFSFLYRPQDSNATFRLWFYADDGSTQALQLESQNLNLKLGFATTTSTGYTFTAGEDYLVVGKITASASGNDQFAVNIYHSSDTVPASEPIFTHTRTGDSALRIDRVMFGIPFNNAADTADIRFDEFRMDRSYAAVVGNFPIDDSTLRNGLLAHWPFDDASNPTRDISPNDFNASLNTANANFAPGRFGSGLQLSGSDTAQAGDLPLTGNTTLSVAAWVRHEGAYNSGGWEMIVGKNWTGLALGVNAATDQLRFQIRLDDGSDFFAQINNASTLLPPDTWTHVVAVRDGATLSLYTDGVARSASFTTGASTRPINDNNDPFYLGSHNANGGNYWRGSIDEIRLYQRALSPMEINFLATADPFNTGDPVTDWKNLTFAGLPEGGFDPLAADTVDIDGDGLPNLLEYAFGTDPLSPNSLPFAMESITPVSGSDLGFSFRRLLGDGTGDPAEGYLIGGITYQPEVSNTLAEGDWHTGSVWMEAVGSPTDNGDGTETVTLRALTPETTPTGPADPDQHFFRLRIDRE